MNMTTALVGHPTLLEPWVELACELATPENWPRRSGVGGTVAAACAAAGLDALRPLARGGGGTAADGADMIRSWIGSMRT